MLFMRNSFPLLSLDGPDAPERDRLRIQLALEVISRIRELIGALSIGKDPHNTVFLAWFERRRSKLTHKKGQHLLLLHIVALAVDHGRPRFLCSQVFLPVSSTGEV